MRILVTNDDGFDAPGIAVLVAHLEALRDGAGRQAHEIWVVAPDTERSGVSHGMSLRHPSKVKMRDIRKYTCSGLPADCVILSGLGIVEGKIDMVVSGINRGPNIGTDIIYSGTCAAARQAALSNIPGIAVSCAAYADPMDYSAAAAFVARHLAALGELWKPGVFININAPSSHDTDLQALWTVPGRNHYFDTLKTFDGEDGYRYCFLTGGRHVHDDVPFADDAAVADGFIALSLVDLHPRAAQEPGLHGSIVF